MLDEPTSAQDVAHRDRFFSQVLETLGDRILFVITHDRDRLEWASHIMELENGGINVRKHNSPYLVHPLPVESDESEFVMGNQMCP